MVNHQVEKANQAALSVKAQLEVVRENKKLLKPAQPGNQVAPAEQVQEQVALPRQAAPAELAQRQAEPAEQV